MPRSFRGPRDSQAKRGPLSHRLFRAEGINSTFPGFGLAGYADPEAASLGGNK